MSNEAARISKEKTMLETTCGLFDRSARGKLALTGSDAKDFLTGQVTNDILSLEPGTGCYAAFLTTKGKMLGDLRVLDTGEELLLDTERIALQALFDVLRKTKIGFAVELHKRTLEQGLLSLMGPLALAAAGLPTDSLPEAEFSNRQVTVDGIDCLAARSWCGIDLFCPNDLTTQLHRHLLSQGAEEIDEATVECLRIERGIPRYGVDIDTSTIPQEAGLNERTVSFTKGCYTGQETVARLHYKGRPNRHLRGLLLSEPVAEKQELFSANKAVGQLSSFTCSPVFGPIALATLRREILPGATVLVGKGEITARVVELPFSAS